MEQDVENFAESCHDTVSFASFSEGQNCLDIDFIRLSLLLY